MLRSINIKAFLKVSLLLVLLLSSSNAQAFTEKYLDCKNGNDGSDGTSEANAWLTPQKAWDTGVAGERVNIEWDDSSFDCTLAAVIDVDSANSDVTFQGYSVTIGDGVKAVIDGNSAVANIFSCIAPDRLMFIDLEFKGSTGDVWTSGSGCDEEVFFRNKVTNSGGDGLHGCNGCFDYIFMDNEITGTTTEGIQTDSSGRPAVWNNIHDTTLSGILPATGDMYFNNIIDTTGSHGIEVANRDRMWFIGNTVYNSTGDNINLFNASSDDHIAINNIFDTASSYNVDGTNGYSFRFYGHNNLTNGTTGDSNNLGITFDIGGSTTTDPAFTDAPNQDFSIGALDDLAFPTTYEGSSTTSHFEPGVSMLEETPGGGGGDTTLKAVILN